MRIHRTRGVRRLVRRHQREQAARWGVTMVPARQLSDFDPAALSGQIYLSVDIDGLDPSAPPRLDRGEV